MIQSQDLQNRQIGGRPRGRPPAAVPSERVEIRLPVPLYDVYDRLARQRGEHITDVIKRILRRHASGISGVT